MTGAVLLAAPEQRWTCPNCDLEAVTRGVVGNRYHQCGGLHGLNAPMVPAGTRAKVEAVEREDYIGPDLGRVQLDPERGRPIMSIITTRDTGRDCTVLAPIATGKGDA